MVLRSASDIARSVSYVPSEATTDLDRLDRAKPYVSRVKASSVGSDGIERRGEEWKIFDERVVLQLKTVEIGV